MIEAHVAAATAEAIGQGDLAALSALLTAHDGLASARLPGNADGRTPLHLATDWPGYLPDAPAAVGLLLEFGADPNARSRPDGTGETPLHWAASSDDVDVARALIDGGADLDAPDGSIGTPLANAVGYSCWHVAALLAARGATVDALWIAAALGELDRLEELLHTATGPDAISQAFWHACAAGQRRAGARVAALQDRALTDRRRTERSPAVQLAAAPVGDSRCGLSSDERDRFRRRTR